MLMYRFLGLLFFICFANVCYAQHQYYRNYTTTNGLPIDNVYAAAQNEKGLIWFGTDFGIAKFDGYKFTNYNRSNGIATKAVMDIVYAGGDSCIFISYPNTVQSINGNGKINTLFFYNKFALQLITKHNNNYYIYKRGISGFLFFENNLLKNYDLDSITNLQGLQINAIQSLQNKGVAFCTNKGLFVLQNNITNWYLQNTDVYGALLTSDNKIHVITNKQVLLLNENFNQIELPINFLTTTIILHSTISKQNKIWMRGIDKGLYTVEKSIITSEEKKYNLLNKTIHQIFIDKEENVWLCTDGSGIMMYPKKTFDWYNVENGLANNKVTQLFTNNNKLYIGTENGLSVKQANKITNIVLPKYSNVLQNISKLFATPYGNVGINADNVSAIANVHSKDPFLTIISGKEKIFYAKNTTTYVQDSFVTYTANSGVLEKYFNNKLVNAYYIGQFKIRKTYDIIVANNNVYVGTADGIIVVENNTLKYVDSLNTKRVGEVFQFKIDNKGKLWAASENGLLCFENDNWQYKVVSNNIRKNYCKSLTSDKDGLIWVATWDGIFSTNGVVRNDYNTNIGLNSKTCNAITYNAVTNELIVGTDYGINTINKDLLISGNLIFDVNIEATANDSFFVLQNDKINAIYNKIKFYVNTPYFANTNAISYKYKLDNGNWIFTTSPEIYFQELKAGKHTLNVKVLLNDKEIENKNASFTFTIKQHFYKTWWFLLLSFLIAQLALIKLYDFIIKRKRFKKHIKKQQQVELASLKQQAFTALMNPHFIFNALNSVQHYINKQDRQNANKYLSEFANLIRKSFNSSKNVFSLLDDELEMIKSYMQLEKMRFGEKFNYTINCDENVEEEGYMLPTLVIQPILENAILHGIAPLINGGEINVTITANDNILKIIIIDNGIGIAKSLAEQQNKLHQSRGMQLIKDRIDLLSKFNEKPLTLEIGEAFSSNENKGTKVILTVPQDTLKAYLDYAKNEVTPNKN